jgi:hypothetical protein
MVDLPVKLILNTLKKYFFRSSALSLSPSVTISQEVVQVKFDQNCHFGFAYTVLLAKYNESCFCYHWLLLFDAYCDHISHVPFINEF